MAKENVANTDLTIAPTDPLITGATFTVTSSPSTKVKAASKGVYKGGIGIIVNGATNTSTGCVQNAPANGTINTSGSKVKAEGSLVNRENDTSAPITINGLIGGVTPCSFPLTAKVTNGGQSKVKAE